MCSKCGVRHIGFQKVRKTAKTTMSLGGRFISSPGIFLILNDTHQLFDVAATVDVHEIFTHGFITANFSH